MQDRKRIYGPEVTNAVKPFTPLTVPDRSNTSHRPIFTSKSNFRLLEVGSTKLVSKVYLQQHYQLQTSVTVDFKFLPFALSSRKNYLKSDVEKEFSLLIQQAIKNLICVSKYDKMRIEISIVCIESLGLYSTLAHAINCAGLALIDAEIEVFGLITASAISFNELNIVLDDESDDKEGYLILATIDTKVVMINQIGKIDKIAFEKGMIMAKEGCEALKGVLRDNLLSTI